MNEKKSRKWNSNIDNCWSRSEDGITDLCDRSFDKHVIWFYWTKCSCTRYEISENFQWPKGRGILTTAKETKSEFISPLLDLEYRREQLISELHGIDSWSKLQSEKNSDPEFQKFIREQTEKRKKIAKSNWSNDFYVAETSISPLKGALAVWGLTIDDLGFNFFKSPLRPSGVVSMHGTSTQANDKNESEVIQAQMSHLGRTKGNILFTILQKYLTGHPKVTPNFSHLISEGRSCCLDDEWTNSITFEWNSPGK